MPVDPDAIATWVLAGVTLVSAAFVVWQLVDGTRTRADQTTFLRRQETLRLYSATEESRNTSRLGLPRDSDAAAVAAYCERATADERHRRAIRDYLNYWEQIAIGVRFGVLDADVLHALIGPRLVSIFTNYRPHIEWIRAGGRPSTFMVEVERMIGGWTAD